MFQEFISSFSFSYLFRIKESTLSILRLDISELEWKRGNIGNCEKIEHSIFDTEIRRFYYDKTMEMNE